MAKKISIPLKAVSLREEGFHLFVKARLGKLSMRLLIDTGASKTVLDKNFLSKNFPGLSLEANEQLTTGVGTNSIQSEFAEIDLLQIGKLRLKNYKVAVLDLQHVNETYSMIQLPGIDGVLGCDVLVEKNAVIDLRKSELRIKTYK